MMTKLILQSDDYGITPAVASGIIYGIEHGAIRNTGFFTNMAWAPECAEMIKPYLDKIALGIDFNLCNGFPVCDPKDVPSLVDAEGRFIDMNTHRRLFAEDNPGVAPWAPGKDHCDPADIEREFRAQLERYRELIGKDPDYFHAHAYCPEPHAQVIRQLAEECGKPCTLKMHDYDNVGSTMGWYINPPTYENQMKADMLGFLLDPKNTAALLEKEYIWIVCHCGYVDEQLFHEGNFNVVRTQDLRSVTSPEFFRWMEENDVVLSDFREFLASQK